MVVVYTSLGPICERALADAPPTAVPPAYRARHARVRSAGVRARTLAGLRLLALGLPAFGCSENLLDRIGFSASGRPEITDGPAFSIAHSASLVACAIGDGATTVGLDVERRHGKVPWRLSRLMRGDAPHFGRDFFDDWCAREATVKASGRVGLARMRALRLHPAHARLDERDWPLRALEILPGYAACLASDAPIGAVDIVAADLGVSV